MTTLHTPAKTNKGNEEAEAALNTLVHMRGMAQGNVTRIKNILARAEADQTELTPAQVKVYIKKVETAYTEYHQLHQQVMASLPINKREEQDAKYLSFEALHEEVSTILETWLGNLTAPPQNQLQQMAPVTGNQQPVVIQQSLPRAIPTFDGRYENWEKFKIMFRDAVDRTNEAPRIKLYHLEKALVGDAMGLIDVKTISDGNYEHAWKLLEERFEDKRRMIDIHIAGLLGTKKIPKDDYADLRTLVESISGHVENLKFLNQQFTGVSELIVVHLVARSLDATTKKEWESTIKRGELPTYENTIKFLKDRVSVLERCQGSNEESRSQRGTAKQLTGKFAVSKANTVTASSTSDPHCEMCGERHPTFKCSSFNSLSTSERLSKVKERNICFNCLRRGHSVKNCPSKKSCFRCNKKHHTLLHLEGNASSTRPSSESSEEKHSQSNPNSAIGIPGSSKAPESNKKPETQPLVTAVHTNNPMNLASQVILLTALVQVDDQHQRSRLCKALLDCGSQVSFVTQSLVATLGIKVEEVSVPITGIGSVRSTIKQKCTINVRSRCNDYSFLVNCLVSPKITGRIPSVKINLDNWELPQGLKLADPSFHEPSQIDLLIGMDWFYDIMKPGCFKLNDDLPSLHDSQLGWLVGGKLLERSCSNLAMNSCAVSVDPMEELMHKFWEVESVSPEMVPSSEKEQCEAHFTATYRRDDSGRFILHLPLKDNAPQLADSRSMALRRFYMLESKLQRNPDLKVQYDAFLDEYETLGHCHEIKEHDDPPGILKFYLPHHAVLRPSKTTTKCRVVFNASAKVFGLSLNDVMMVGATVQSDLLSIILRFRKFRYVLSADVSKMYRQMLIDPAFTPLQRIFWRKSPQDPLRVLELSTVTYGTAAAPFLATRALLQLARDERHRFPLAAMIVERNFYIDDALFGSDDYGEACELRDQLIGLLKSGGMHLHKWSSNDDSLLDPIPNEDRERCVPLGDSGINDIIKTLGLMWNPSTDEFLFRSQSPEKIKEPTKRQVLSEIAKIFDPLGLISPVVVVAKILMQNLWICKLKWDDPLDDGLLYQWESFLTSLPSCEQIRIPRQVISSEAIHYELHGFADASQKAYGACVYVRSIFPDGRASLRLVSAKSKIAPITPVTIPRKELLAARLLTRLNSKVKEALEMNFTSTILWSDSQVVLAWLRKPLDSLQVFVRHRVAEITSHKHIVWKYVRTDQNPADSVSRGQAAKELAENDLWWNGPHFLRTVDYQEEKPITLTDVEIPELRVQLAALPVMNYEEFPLLTKNSSFRKTQRILAYVLRFISNTRKKKEDRLLSAYLTLPELRTALHFIVGAVQHQEFSKEIECIRSGEFNHRLNNLKPFLHNDLLRVGGRLSHSDLPFEVKHQLILPDKSPIVRGLIADIHRENLHTGCSSVQYLLRQQFWLINARSTIRKVLRGCVTCFRMKPTTIDQQMGDLPSYRVTSAPAFERVGLDFAGPIYVKQPGRKATSIKGYICVFVCMVTKAMHLEAVEDLSADSFLASFQRFVSRRGFPKEVFSDNGTNFIGARSALRDLYLLFKEEATQNKIFEYCQAKQIDWRTIPPNAPHFGGLWEAGVKSVKTVLKKVYQSTSLTLFGLSTLLCQIEAILNSRPLYSLSSDPTEPEVLTPGHFIINRPLLAIPEPSLMHLPTNRLSHWQRIQQLREHFWKRRSKEYVTELQVSGKWTNKRNNIRPGMIVVLKEDNLPPQCWRLGRVVKVYPGADDLVRVVDVQTKTGTFQRPIHKLAPLPIADNESSSAISTSCLGENVQSNLFELKRQSGSERTLYIH
ncbi:uncharacterized protein LOC129720280 [Wyeomyia smithii]|uniref:uncharacterized protein LOC129720280 n=1 Tax=Wyeomyia smithii TaxID=174621 RepID=UPI002467F3AA|nr:uncharacterized protein LOC129720280 [Wyeomyia smithii]